MTVLTSEEVRTSDRALIAEAFDRAESRSTLFSSTFIFLSYSDAKKEAMSP